MKSDEAEKGGESNHIRAERRDGARMCAGGAVERAVVVDTDDIGTPLC